MHFAKPVKLSVEREMLQDAEERHKESETHPKPNEAPPVLESSECLRGQKENEDIGEKKL